MEAYGKINILKKSTKRELKTLMNVLMNLKTLYIEANPDEK